MFGLGNNIHTLGICCSCRGGNKRKCQGCKAQKLFNVNVKIHIARPQKNATDPDLPNPLLKQ